MTSAASNELIRSSVQYRLTRGALTYGVAPLVGLVLLNVVLGFWITEHFYEAALLGGVLIIFGWLLLGPFQNAKSPQELDVVVTIMFLGVMLRNLGSVLWLQQRDGLTESLLLVTVASFMFTSNRLFWSLAVNCIVLMLGSQFFLGKAVALETYAQLLIVLPVVCWVSRSVCETNYAKVFRQGQTEIRLSNELDKVRTLLNQAMNSKEKLDVKIRHLDSQIAAILDVAPIRIRHLNRQGVAKFESGDIETPPFAISTHDDLLLMQIFTKSTQGQTQRVSKTINDLLEAVVVFRPLFDHRGNVDSIAEITYEQPIEAPDKNQPPSTQHPQQHSRRMESLGRLAAGIAHDFNNYLLAIVQFSEFINGKLNDRAILGHVDLELLRQSASEIQRTAISASGVCKEILMYSGQIRSSKSLSDLNEVLFGFQAILNNVVAPNVELQFEFGNLPMMVMIDQSMIQRLMVNIIKNASESIRVDRGKIEITTSQKRLDEPDAIKKYYVSADFVPSPQYAQIVIRDNGEGMDAETVERIFTPYFSKKKQAGHGLGLAISEGIVAFHNGLIRCSSEVGIGTQFEILLPQKTLTVEQESLSSKSKANSASLNQPNQPPRKLLVVDDERAVRQSIQWILEAHGHQVETAESGEQALSILDQTPEFDCLILDYSMPEMNGLELLQAVQGRGIQLKSILCTGCFSSIENAEQYPQPSELLGKPYEFVDLQAAIERVIAAPKPVTIEALSGDTTQTNQSTQTQ